MKPRKGSISFNVSYLINNKSLIDFQTNLKSHYNNKGCNLWKTERYSLCL